VDDSWPISYVRQVSPSSAKEAHPDGEAFDLAVFVSADMAKTAGGVERLCHVERLYFPPLLFVWNIGLYPILQ